jgi:hypothetical protein
MDPDHPTDPADWVARYGDLLYRYARLRVRDADAAPGPRAGRASR